MARTAVRWSAAALLISQTIPGVQCTKAAAASGPRAALVPAALAPAPAPASAPAQSQVPTTSRAFVTPAVATLASQNNSTAGRAGAPTPAAEPIQPPQIIIETNYIIYTAVKTLSPVIITVTQTQSPVVQQPSSPPPPPKQPLPKQPLPPPPPPAASAHPNAVPLANPNPIAAPILNSPSPLLPTPKTTPQVAAASSSSPSTLPPPPATTLINSGTPPPPLLNPIMSSPAPGRGGQPSSNPNPQAQAGPPGGGPPMGPPDPANGAFPGGVPNKNIDLPVTIMFMLLFMLGAYVHLTIYRRNAKRGHKFLISDLMFDFCMIRTVTCIFRITWSIVTTRGVVMMALVTENSGVVLMFAVNLFFAQRLVRSIHPRAGWCTAFGQFSTFLLFSVPAIIIFNATNLIVSFFSVGNLDRLETTDELLKFGSGWIMFLAAFPVIVVTVCLCVPGPEPEKFGNGSLRVKVALLFFGAFVLMTGHIIRMYTLFNKEPPGTDSIIFGKAVFYTTGFMLELLAVAVYAFGRVDLRFHIPNGSSAPGDYSGDKDRGKYSVEEIERLIGDMDIPHQIMRERKSPEDMEMVFAIFFATKTEDDEKKGAKSASEDQYMPGINSETGSQPPGETPLPSRPKRISRRQTVLDALKPPRPEREPTMYPDITDMYAQMDEQAPRRPKRPSMYSEFETRQGYDYRYDARNHKNWGASPPYGNEKETLKSIDLR